MLIVPVTTEAFSTESPKDVREREEDYIRFAWQQLASIEKFITNLEKSKPLEVSLTCSFCER